MKYRLASPADSAMLCEQAPAFPAPAFAPINLDKTRAEIARMCAGAGWIILLIDDDGAYVGSLALVPVDWWWSDARGLVDRWLHVAGDRRGLRAALGLIGAGRGLAARVGRILVVGDSIGDRPELKARLYRLAGGQLLGSGFLFRSE